MCLLQKHIYSGRKSASENTSGKISDEKQLSTHNGESSNPKAVSYARVIDVVKTLTSHLLIFFEGAHVPTILLVVFRVF